MAKEISNDISEAIQNSIPKIKIFEKMKYPFTPEIREQIKQKNKLLNIYIKNKILNTDYNEDLTNYRKAIKDVKKSISSFNDKVWNEFTEKVGQCPISSRIWWNKIKKLTNTINTSKTPTLLINSRLISDQNSIANAFADRMKNTLNENTNEDFDNLHKKTIDNLVENFLKQNHDNTTFDLINIEELNKAIQKLNTKTTCDSNNISNRCLKEIPNNTKNNIITLFNNCIKNKTLPLYWKSATLSMLYKKGDRKNILN